MAALVKKERRNPLVREFTATLVDNVAPKDFVGEAQTVFYFVQNNVRYVQDINEVETLYVPSNLLTRIINGGAVFGDCDDMVTLLCSMLESIGHPCRLVAISTEGPEDFSHVIAQTKIADTWISMDATEPEPFGWGPPYNYFLIWWI